MANATDTNTFQQSAWSVFIVPALIGALSGVIGAGAGAYVAREGQRENLMLEIIRHADSKDGASAVQAAINLAFWKRIGVLQVTASPLEIRQAECDCNNACELPNRAKLTANPNAC